MSYANVLLMQARAEQRRTSEAFRMGFLCGLFLGCAGAVALGVPLALWMVRA